MAEAFGIAGKILRINLSENKITTQDTTQYAALESGGLGLQIIADEIEPGTKAYDDGNKLIFAAGPLVGTGVPGACITTITGLSPLYEAPFMGSMGGRFGAQLKYAGYDAVIIEGKASAPVWVRIADGEASLQSAAAIWGSGIKNATAHICSMADPASAVACIGQAGENQIPLASIVNSGGHSAGGHGGVMGAKNLKAIAVRGQGGLRVGDPAGLLAEYDRILTSVIGAYDGCVVPSAPQSWAEYHNPESRWTARPGLYWEAAQPPVETGECPPGELARVGYRSMNTVADFGQIAAQYTIRMGGCPSCPVNCVSCLKLPRLEAMGITPYVTATSKTLLAAAELLPKFKDVAETGDGRLYGAAAGASLADDFGLWLADGQLGRDFNAAYASGALKAALPANEYNAIDWERMEEGDPVFLLDFFRRIATAEGELAHLGDGSAALAQRWKLGEEYFKNTKAAPLTAAGRAAVAAGKTGGETLAALAALSPLPLDKPLANLIGCGLPQRVVSALAGTLAGGSAENLLDANDRSVLVSRGKAALAGWSARSSQASRMLGLCGHLWPMAASPDKGQGYAGDTGLEAKLLSLVTGQSHTPRQLEQAAEKSLALFSGLAALYRETPAPLDHSLLADWVYDPEGGGMNAQQMDALLALICEELGWEQSTGRPLPETLNKLGLEKLAEAFAAVVTP